MQNLLNYCLFLFFTHTTVVSSSPILSEKLHQTPLAFSTSTSVTNLSCNHTVKDCLPNSVCYHRKCRCKLGFIWIPHRKVCLPKKCTANYDCASLDGNSMCNGDGCICTFGYRLEPTSQMCTYSGFMSPNAYVFFGLLLGIVVLLWVMVPGFIIILRKRSRKSRGKRIRAQEGQRSNETSPPSSPAPSNALQSINPFEDNINPASVGDQSQTTVTPIIRLNPPVPNNTPIPTDSEPETPNFQVGSNPFEVSGEHSDQPENTEYSQPSEIDNILFQISRELLAELGQTSANLPESQNGSNSTGNSSESIQNSISNQNRAHSQQNPSSNTNSLISSRISRQNSANSGNSGSSSRAHPSSQLSSINSVTFGRMNSQNSQNSGNSGKSSMCIDSLYNPPPPYTPTSSPETDSKLQQSANVEPSTFQSELLADVPTDLLSQAFLDSILSNSNSTAQTQTTPRPTRPSSRLVIRSLSSSNHFTSLLGEPIAETEEEEPEIVGPICQQPPPYLKRCDNSLDTGNLPEPCTSRAAVTRIIEEENREAAQKRECCENKGNLHEDGETPASDEDDDENSTEVAAEFDYTRSLNRDKMKLI